MTRRMSFVFGNTLLVPIASDTLLTNDWLMCFVRLILVMFLEQLSADDS